MLGWRHAGTVTRHRAIASIRIRAKRAFFNRRAKCDGEELPAAVYKYLTF